MIFLQRPATECLLPTHDGHILMRFGLLAPPLRLSWPEGSRFCDRSFLFEVGVQSLGLGFEPGDLSGLFFVFTRMPPFSQQMWMPPFFRTGGTPPFLRKRRHSYFLRKRRHLYEKGGICLLLPPYRKDAATDTDTTNAVPDSAKEANASFCDWKKAEPPSGRRHLHPSRRLLWFLSFAKESICLLFKWCF